MLGLWDKLQSILWTRSGICYFNISIIKYHQLIVLEQGTSRIEAAPSSSSQQGVMAAPGEQWSYLQSIPATKVCIGPVFCPVLAGILPCFTGHPQKEERLNQEQQPEKSFKRILQYKNRRRPGGCFLNTTLRGCRYAYRKHTASTTPRGGTPGGIGTALKAAVSTSCLPRASSRAGPLQEGRRRHRANSLELPEKQQEEA